MGLPYDHAVDVWSLGCIAYELITGSVLFPAHDENELIEYFVVTIGKVPMEMLPHAKKYKQFYKPGGGFLSSYKHDLIRSKNSSLGFTIGEKS